MDADTASAKGVGNFSIRASLLPTTKEEVSFWIAVTPFSKADLVGKLGAILASSPQVPSISLSITGVQPGAKPAKLTKAALGVPEPEATDLGLGVLALLDISQCNAPQLPTVSQ